MRLNSAFPAFLIKQPVMKSRVAIVFFAFLFIASSFKEYPGRDLTAKQVNLIIRQIGDRLLLQAGDSTSRVLPVTEIKKGTFLLRFENEFDFVHDSLMVLTQHLLSKTQFPAGFTVTVHDCTKGDIVFGFQVNNTSSDLMPCKGRSQPAGCYTIEFTFPDFYANVEEENAGIGYSGKINPRDLRPGQAAIKTTTSDVQSEQKAKDGKLVMYEPQNLKPEESRTTLIYLMCGGLLVLLGAALLIARFRKNLKAAPAEAQNHVIITESVPASEALGKFSFNAKGQRLVLGTEVISLTDKECRVLEILHKNFGELIPRDTLMQEVWINDGVITGRSLDMFISKLRKKLSGDGDLRITNVHGKGYRLET